MSVASFAIYLGFKSRTRNGKTKEPRFGAPSQATDTTPEFTPASQAELVDDAFQRIDDVLGHITVDGIKYRTFDAGEVLIYDKNDRPVIAFKVDGYMNAQRTINYVKVSNHVEKVNGVIFHVKHNPADHQLFSDWLNQQMYGGDYAREALYFKDLMTEIGKFNQLLASRKVGYKAGNKYVTN